MKVPGRASWLLSLQSNLGTSDYTIFTAIGKINLFYVNVKINSQDESMLIKHYYYYLILTGIEKNKSTSL